MLTDTKQTEMSDLIINIRILMWHFQINNDWVCKVIYNPFHKGLKNGWFEIYTFKPFKY